MSKVKGYNNCFSTGKREFSVEIDGFKTVITNFIKDGNRLFFVYCIKNKDGDFIDLDVRDIKNFPRVSPEKMLESGLTILKNNIEINQSNYSHLL